jgi:[protein-PII] uridylyltransferase
LLELFVLLQQNPNVKGVHAGSMRALSRSLWLIDEEFRQNPRHHRLFLEMLRAPAGVTHELRRMNTYGVLGRYIPAFGRIVGRMQYDLFHAYTVDAHTLFVLSNLRRLAIPRYDRELPALSAIMQQLPRPELAYLAALFHDIAKGRGGDHSELGSVDAEAFCLEQGLSRYDARLVAWLVRAHLKLSVTAQKQDISDPEVINAFARFVGDETHLDYLYVLTASDVRGTNPKLWNSWKASLFQEFYDRIKRALRRGLETPIDAQELRDETQVAARLLLAESGMSDQRIRDAWSILDDGYFLRHTADEVAWHTRLIASRPGAQPEPVLSVQAESAHGTTAITTLTPDRLRGFARVTAVLDQLGLTIVDARVTPTTDGGSLDLYHVLEGDGAPLTHPERVADIERALRRALVSTSDQSLAVTRRASRQMRMFNTPTQIALNVDERNRRTVLELVAGDRPGLLCDIGQVLLAEQVALQGAKIMTVGERAEDVFYVTDTQGAPLSDSAAQTLQRRLTETLDKRRAA